MTKKEERGKNFSQMGNTKVSSLAIAPATLEHFLRDGKMSRESYQTSANICRAFVHTCATLIIVASAATRSTTSLKSWY